jgi:hypothetical protein
MLSPTKGSRSIALLFVLLGSVVAQEEWKKI